MTIGVLAMLCGQPPVQCTMDTGAIIELDRVITEYAWRELKRDIKWYDCMKKSCFTFEVSWNFFEFDHNTTQFQLRSGAVEGGYREKKQVELFRTDFTNNTNKDQVYKLRTQRQTKAATAVAIQRGFTLKGNTNFKLKIPQEIGHFGVSASADGYLRVCRPRGETFEDTFTWHVDSDVTVEANHVTNARLLVTEDELVADFEVRSLIRMPTGEAPIIVRRKSNKEIYAVMMISNLRDVFSDVDCKIISIAKGGDKPGQDGKRFSRYAIEFITTGILESVRWRNQKICLESYPIREAEQTERLVELKAGSPLNLGNNVNQTNLSLNRKLNCVGENIESREKDIHKGARAKKGALRFNETPTVITESPYDVPERILSTLIQETMSLTGSPQKHVRDRAIQMKQQAQLEPSAEEDCACAPSSVITTDRQRSDSDIDKEEIYRTVNSICNKELYSYLAGPPMYKDLGVFEPGSQTSDNASDANISDEDRYMSQVEHFYLRAGHNTMGYPHIQRDITQIVEEPEKERAACMSKQSSVQSEETAEDATESLDSGDSRRVSKVTSV